MDYPQNLSESDRYWFELICQCRASGKSDHQWLQENNIKSPTFYYHVKQLQRKACDIPKSNYIGRNDIQEVVPLLIEETEPVTSNPVFINNVKETDTVSIRLNIQGFSVEMMNNATQEIIKNTLAALRFIC